MKTSSFLVYLLLLALVLTACATPTPAPVYDEPPASTPDIFAYPTAVGLTPASMEVIVGRESPAVAVDNDWTIYGSRDLGISIGYPPTWQSFPMADFKGVMLCPPGSEPDLPTPKVTVEWLNVPYSPDQPLVQANSDVSPIEVGGHQGRMYADSQFALPTQSIYMEMPYRDGTLFFTVTIGPSVNLMPQFVEILQTIVFLDDEFGSGSQDNSTSSNSFEEGVSATEGWQNTQIHVQVGTTLIFETVAGQWTHWNGNIPFNTGDGATDYICADNMPASQCVEPLPEFPTGALIGEVNGQVFGIGSGNMVTVQESGTLYLRINDSDEGLFDNYGELTVQVTLSN